MKASCIGRGVILAVSILGWTISAGTIAVAEETPMATAPLPPPLPAPTPALPHAPPPAHNPVVSHAPPAVPATPSPRTQAGTATASGPASVPAQHPARSVRGPARVQQAMGAVSPAAHPSRGRGPAARGPDKTAPALQAHLRDPRTERRRLARAETARPTPRRRGWQVGDYTERAAERDVAQVPDPDVEIPNAYGSAIPAPPPYRPYGGGPGYAPYAPPGYGYPWAPGPGGMRR